MKYWRIWYRRPGERKLFLILSAETRGTVEKRALRHLGPSTRILQIEEQKQKEKAEK